MTLFNNSNFGTLLAAFNRDRTIETKTPKVLRQIIMQEDFIKKMNEEFLEFSFLLFDLECRLCKQDTPSERSDERGEKIQKAQKKLIISRSDVE